jgi:UPF0271 protein
MIHDAQEAATRILRMLDEQAIIATSGKRFPPRIDTICVHGDGPTAVGMARALRDALEQAGVTIKPISQLNLG